MFPKKLLQEAAFELVLALQIHLMNLPFYPLREDKSMQVP